MNCSVAIRKLNRTSEGLLLSNIRHLNMTRVHLRLHLRQIGRTATVVLGVIRCNLVGYIIDCSVQLINLIFQLLLCYRRLVLFEPVGGLEFLLFIQNSPRDLYSCSWLQHKQWPAGRARKSTIATIYWDCLSSPVVRRRIPQHRRWRLLERSLSRIRHGGEGDLDKT